MIAKRFETPTYSRQAAIRQHRSSTVDQYRAPSEPSTMAIIRDRLAAPRNQLDGGSPTNATTSLSGTPLATFFEHPAQHHHTRKRLRQAPPSGLADTFGHDRATPQSSACLAPLRLFSPIGVTSPRSGFPFRQQLAIHQRLHWLWRGFTDVDSPDGSRLRDRTGNRHASTLIEYYGTTVTCFH